MRHAIRVGLLLLAVGLALSGIGYSQNIMSSIVGLVTDPSGAAVPGVEITVTNQGTGIAVHATTDAAGTYTVSSLYAGVYGVQAKKAGFESVQTTGIVVLAGRTMRQDLVLRVGSVQQSVTVHGQAPLLNTENAQIAGEILTRQLTELPAAYQTIDTFLPLVPGAQFLRGNPKSGGAQFWGGTSFTVDGMMASDFGNDRVLYAYGVGNGSLAMPPVSSLQELKVNSAEINAEYRLQDTIDLVTKQGTNKFHGEAYEFNQNAVLEANSLTLNATGKPRPPFNLNQFGANLGGPIWRNKAFFFFNFSGTRQRTYTTISQTLPTVAMQQGNFGALCSTFTAGVCTSGTQLYNPNTGQPFPSNQIPTTMITSQAQTMLKYLPAPNVAGASGVPNSAADLYDVVSAPKDVDSYSGRGDWQVSEADRLTFTYQHNVGFPWFQATGTPRTYGNGLNYGYKSQQQHLDWSRTLTPHTINDLRVGRIYYRSIRQGQNLDFDPRSLFPQILPSFQRGVPKASWTGYSGFGDVGNGRYAREQIWDGQENFTYVHGRHTLKAGYQFLDLLVFSYGGQVAMPTFSFSGKWSGGRGWPGLPTSQGNGFADFLLGDADSSSTGLYPLDGCQYEPIHEGYVQDTWQASPRLTLYFGVRYMYAAPWRTRDNYVYPWYDRNRNMVIFSEASPTPVLRADMDPNTFKYFLPYFTTTQALNLPTHNQMYYPYRDAWGPRFSFAYRPFSNNQTVLRGGYGMYYSFISYGVIQAGMVPLGFAPLNFYSALPGSPTSPFLPDLTFANPFPSTIGGAVVAANPTLGATDPNKPNTRNQVWTLTLERQLGLNNMARISYVGSKTTHGMIYSADFNQPFTQTPYAPIQNQRPLQPWSSINDFSMGAMQNFDSLQLGFVRHFARGLSTDFEYQWTRSLTNADDTGWPNRYWYQKLPYSNSSFIPIQQLIFNYFYELPVGRGRRWLSNTNGVVDALLGGWQTSAITTYLTGIPFSVYFTVPSSYTGWWGGLADRVAGAALYAGQQKNHNIISGVPWFNTAAFAAPQPFQWGDAQPLSVFGPGYENWDMSAQKEFKIPIRGLETPRLQVRADFLNAFNHFNLARYPGYPSTPIADTRDGGLPSATQGKITGQQGSNRIIQVGLRLAF